MRLLDQISDHKIVHTGQNYDYELNEIFFNDFKLRKPDYFLEAETSSLGATLGSILFKIERVLLEETPDAMLVLGDTNSCISAIMAKRLNIPVYHMEAGNRCFDQNVPEETNRKIVDHVADYNLVYSEQARQNLLFEGIHPSRILLTGSPMYEVLNQYKEQIENSDILSELSLQKGMYFVASIHRQENVDDMARLCNIISALNLLAEEYELPIIVSTHPRTRAKLETINIPTNPFVQFLKPFGFHDYISLQKNSKLVLSDSGTISEESSILGFPAITIRDTIERPEAQDVGSIILSEVEPESVVSAVKASIKLFGLSQPEVPSVYSINNTSKRVVSYILSTAPTHFIRNGIRKAPPNIP